jgi:hypothetical protein
MDSSMSKPDPEVKHFQKLLRGKTFCFCSVLFKL